MAAAALHAVKVYGHGETAVRALDDVSVQVPSFRFTAIMGPSGSGKSTLMHCLAGLDRLTSGETYIGGLALSGLSERQLTRLRRERIGFVFQAFNLRLSMVQAIAGASGSAASAASRSASENSGSSSLPARNAS